MRRLKVVDKSTLCKRALERNINLKCLSFFESTRNALITSILGNAAEASRMSGGDYDGDRAWISWNVELLDCLPCSDAFMPEDTSTFHTSASELENTLWKSSSEMDLLKYMLNFRNHHRILGELCELLDCYIDNYGFNNEKTRELGRAAFLQVRFTTLFAREKKDTNSKYI